MIFETIKDKLNRPGKVTTGECVSMCCIKWGFSYATVQHILKYIMEQMVKDGNARVHKRGEWEVYYEGKMLELPILSTAGYSKQLKVESVMANLVARNVNAYSFLDPPKHDAREDVYAKLKELSNGKKLYNHDLVLEVCEQHGVSLQSFIEYYLTTKNKNK